MTLITQKPDGLAPTPNDLDNIPDDLLGPHPARASESQYLADLAWHGIYSPGGATTLLGWGYRVCVDQDRGFSMAYSANNIWLQNNIDYNGAMQVVASAKLFLC